MPLFKTALFSVLNLLLLIIFSVWLWYQNQPVALVMPTLPDHGNMQCASYAPYYKPGQSPFIQGTHISKQQIRHDLAILAQRFDCVRTYSVGQGLDYVPEAAAEVGLDVLLGVWIGWTEAENQKELKLGIKLANQYPDVIRGLIIGNEVLLRQEQPLDKMMTYIQEANAATDVPVTYADVWEFWLRNPALESAVDYITVHVLPYWEDDPQSIEHAIPHANAVMEKLSHTFSKPLFIGETGWPSVGRHRNASAPGAVNQARYIREFLEIAQEKGWKYNLIEAFDQPWKRVLEGTVGGHWGLYDSNLQPKFSLDQAKAEREDGVMPLIWVLASIVLFSLWMSLTLGIKKASAYFHILPLAALSGLVAYWQLAYLVSACRDIWEWLALGGAALLGWITILMIPALKEDVQWAKSAMYSLVWLLTLTAMMATALIVFDGRYRDFPLSLYALPALQLGLVCTLSGISIGRLDGRYRLFALLAVIYAGLALWPEPLNQHACWWLGITLLLLACGFQNIRLARQDSSSQ